MRKTHLQVYISRCIHLHKVVGMLFIIIHVTFLSTDDKDRKFLIQYYLADDTIGVAEPPQRNSGIMGGKFLRRDKYKKLDESRFGPFDFSVGEVVTILNHRFEILEADAYTEKWYAAGGAEM